MKLRSFTFACIAGLLTISAASASTIVPPKMTAIPGGKLTTLTCPGGSNKMCPEHEYVMREVSITAFEMAATEVTFADWDACVQDQACASEKSDWAYLNRPVHAPCVENEVCQFPHDEGWGRGQRPVIHVSWNDVQQYIKWLNQKTGSSYRLPSAEEWEYAALGGATTKFDWGPSLGRNRANCDGCGSKWDNKQSSPVASFKSNKFGLFDMVGNVSEWVSSCFPTRARKNEVSQTCMTYMIRGAAWSTVAKSADPRLYTTADPTLRDSFVGFRLARSSSP